MHTRQRVRGRAAVVVALLWAAAVSLSTAVAWDAEPTLLIPVAVSVVPVGVFRHRQGVQATVRWGATVGLVLWVLVASFSVGVFYVPSAVAMGIAAWRADSA
jgi:hypothetical protein